MLNRRAFLLSTLGAATAGAFAPASFGADTILPFKLFDTHAHFYTNDVANYPFNASGARFGAEQMIAKAMAHPMTPDVVFAFWDAVGVEMGTGVQYNSTYGTDNSYLLDVSAQHPDRILPVVILAPVDATTPDTLRRFATERRLTAVRFSGAPDERGAVPFLSDAAQDAWASANELGIGVVLMPTGVNIPQALRSVADHAQRYPNVKIVLDHIGYPRVENFPATFGLSPEHLELAQHANVYVKFTSLLISELETRAAAAGQAMVDLTTFVEYVVATFGARRMMWGSDHGNVEVDDIEYVRRALAAAAGLPEADQRAFFYDTAKSVFIPGGRGQA